MTDNIPKLNVLIIVKSGKLGQINKSVLYKEITDPTKINGKIFCIVVATAAIQGFEKIFFTLGAKEFANQSIIFFIFNSILSLFQSQNQVTPHHLALNRYFQV